MNDTLPPAEQDLANAPAPATSDSAATAYTGGAADTAESLQPTRSISVRRLVFIGAIGAAAWVPIIALVYFIV